MAKRRHHPETAGLRLTLILATSALVSATALGQVFVPGAAKRQAPGPFDAASIVQGDPANADSLDDDILSFSRGAQIGGTFYSRVDMRQGSLVLWSTPEYSSVDLSGTGRHMLFSAGNALQLYYMYDTDQFVLSIGSFPTLTMNVSQSISAGTTYSIVARYPRVAMAEGGKLEGSWSSSGIAEVTGLRFGAHAVDVTESDPRWLNGSRIDDNGTLRFRAESGRSYLVVSPDAVLHPEVRKTKASRLKSGRNRKVCQS